MVRETFFSNAKLEFNPEVTRDFYRQKRWVLKIILPILRHQLAVLQRDIVSQLGRLSPVSQLMSRACREYRDVCG